jgi:hypothetical protein
MPTFASAAVVSCSTRKPSPAPSAVLQAEGLSGAAATAAYVTDEYDTAPVNSQGKIILCTELEQQMALTKQA